EASLDIENGPVAKLVVYHTFKGDYVMAVIHHLFVDGVSWRVLTEDMNTAYRQLKDEKEVELPLKTHSYKEYAESLETYRKSYELRQEKSYWEGVLSDMRKYPLSVGNDYSRKMSTVVRQVNKDTTNAIVHNSSKAYNTTINDLLLTAVGRSYTKVFDAEGLSLQFEGHGREPFGQTPLSTDRTVGWFTSMYPVVIDGLTGDIRKDVRRVKEILHRIPNNGFGFGQLFGISPEETPLMIFNYMGDLSESGSNDGTGAQFTMSGDFSTGLQIAPENCYGSDFSLNILVENGQFQLLFTYNTALCDESRAKGFVAEMESQLGAIAQHTSQISVPELTASDLGETQWSDDAFEKISGEYASRNEMIQRIYPITPMQEAMLLKHISEPDSWGYRLVNSFELDIVPTEGQLRAVLDKLGRKHEVLRTAIIHEGVYPYRQAIIQRPLGLRMVDLSNSADPYEEARKLREDILSHGFDLQKKPLFHLTCAKISDTRSILITAVHHIIVDGWCLGIYMGDLVNFLDAEVKGIGLPDTQISPVNDGVYEKAVREIISKDMDAARDYWRKLLEGYENKAEIHSFGVVPESERSDADQQHIKFDKATTDSLFSLSLSEGATQ
ncbi:MAG: hypothetical protein KBT00_01050, partial [Bacteroidales bacterium]|nr:hypothetical protein [Candidatus Cacconaster merdequi]